MDTFNYSEKELLDRCYDTLSQKQNINKKNPVKPEIIRANRKTKIVNFMGVCNSLDRDIMQVKDYCFKELSTQGSITEENSLLLNGIFKPAQILDVVTKYIKTRVCCGQCNSRNTNIIKENRIIYIQCHNCLSKKPIE